MKIDKFIDVRKLRELALKKYSSKEEVAAKWISLCRQLNPGKDPSYYITPVMELISLMDYILIIELKDEYNSSDFMENIKTLQAKSNIFPDELIKRLFKIKLLRNLGAHNTKTIISQTIDFILCKEIFSIAGEVLYYMGMLDKEDVNPSPEKLRAKTGDVVGECCLLKEYLGGGATGRVFKARHQRLDIDVAVKEINYDIKDSINIENEKDILLSIKHDGVPRIYDLFYDNQTVYLVMEYIEGSNLDDYIKKAGPMPVPKAIKYCLELCDIISYLHMSGKAIVYNDLKPGNIILGTDDRLYLVDFGMSCKLQAIKEKLPRHIGSLGYSAPEQVNGNNFDHRADIYSLGGVLYFLLEGNDPPFMGQRKYSINTPSFVIDIIEKCMAADPNDRYSNVQELMWALENALGIYEKSGKAAGKKGKIKWPQVSKKAAIAGIFAVLMLLMAAIILLNGKKQMVYTSTQFYKEAFPDNLKQENKIVITPKHVYFDDNKLYMRAFVYNGYNHDIREINNIHIVLSSGDTVVASKKFRSAIRNVKANSLHECLFIFEGSSIKNGDVDLSSIKWDISYYRLD